MVTKKPIRCPNCGKIVFEDEGALGHIVLNDDIFCPDCGDIVVKVPKHVWEKDY